MTPNDRQPKAEALLARLPATPDVYPHTYDAIRQAVLLVELDAARYREASFLDDRLLSPGMTGAWVDAARAVAALRQVANKRPLHFIFHTGHVGSTLISRLLATRDDVLSLREPQSLRALAELHDSLGRPDALVGDAQFAALLEAFLLAWQRGYASTTAVVLKATSSAGRLAGTLLRHAPSSRALYINLRAEPYLATLLGGANSLFDLRGHGPARIRRLNAQLTAPVGPLHALSPGELAAMSWLTETLTQHECLNAHAGRVHALDFDEFLAEPIRALSAIWQSLLLPGTADFASTQVAETLARYSKATEHAYSPALRANILNEARRHQGPEIRRGLVWLRQLGDREPAVAALQNAYSSSGAAA